MDRAPKRRRQRKAAAPKQAAAEPMSELAKLILRLEKRIETLEKRIEKAKTAKEPRARGGRVALGRAPPVERLTKDSKELTELRKELAELRKEREQPAAAQQQAAPVITAAAQQAATLSNEVLAAQAAQRMNERQAAQDARKAEERDKNFRDEARTTLEQIDETTKRSKKEIEDYIARAMANIERGLAPTMYGSSEAGSDPFRGQYAFQEEQGSIQQRTQDWIQNQRTINAMIQADPRLRETYGDDNDVLRQQFEDYRNAFFETGSRASSGLQQYRQAIPEAGSLPSTPSSQTSTYFPDPALLMQQPGAASRVRAPRTLSMTTTNVIASIPPEPKRRRGQGDMPAPGQSQITAFF